MSRVIALISSIAIVMVVAGCSEKYEPRSAANYRLGVDLAGVGDLEGHGAEGAEGAKEPAQGAPQAVAKPEAQLAGDKVPRKIKYTAEIRLVTDQFREAEKDLFAMLRGGARPMAAIECMTCCHYSSVDVVFITFRDLCEVHPRRWIDGIE